MASRTIVAGDTTTPLDFTLMQNGAPINLATANGVQFRMKPKTGTGLVTGAMTILNAASGRVRYQQLAADVATPGDYAIRCRITWSNGPPAQIQTVPIDDTLTILEAWS